MRNEAINSLVKIDTFYLPMITKNILQSGTFIPVGLIGGVGVGKTQWLKNEYPLIVADHFGVQVEDLGFIQVRINGRDGESVGGFNIPAKNNDGEMITTSTLPDLIARVRGTGREFGIILIDELLQADAHTQKVLSDLLDPAERTLNGYALPDGWVICFTGNRSSDRSGANKLLSHLVNRCAIFEMALSKSQWLDWARSNGVNEIIVSTAEIHDDFFDTEAHGGDGNACTPRSVERASDQLNAFELSGGRYDGGKMPAPIEALIGAIIGRRATALISGFIDEANNVTSPTDIINNPMTAHVHDNAGYQRYAIQRAVSHCNCAEDLENALIYASRLRADLQVVAGDMILREGARRKMVLTSEGSREFIAKFHELLPTASACGMEV